MSVVVYLQTDPYHVSVSQGVKVTPGMFVPIDAADRSVRSAAHGPESVRIAGPDQRGGTRALVAALAAGGLWVSHQRSALA
jgi:hypothetical protein